MVLEHPYGCSQLGDDLDNTRAILQALAVHPNAGGVLIMGLGCESNTEALFRSDFNPPDPQRLRYLVNQEVEDEMEAALELLCELAKNIRRDSREPVAINRLRVGLKCGGSDGFSGITANPLLGAFSDWLCRLGGATVLTEVPEMFGAEHLLMERAESRAVFNDIERLINDFKLTSWPTTSRYTKTPRRETRMAGSVHWRRNRWVARKNQDMPPSVTLSVMRGAFANRD